MLECKNLSKQYKGGVKALDNFSGYFACGIYGILGPNGAGKSTLLNMMAQLISPTAGSILFDNCDISLLGSEYRKHIGYLPQNPPAYAWMSARQFLEYMYQVKEINGTGRSVDEALEWVELTDRANDRVKNYSGGMRQRLGIAQAVLGNPKILLLDEPTAGLDPRQRALIKNLLRMLAGNTVILLCTHIVSDLADIADEILMMRSGKLLGMLPPEEWLKRLNGKVWWVCEDGKGLQDYPTAIRSLRAGQSGLRIISAHPPNGAVAVAPNLEDIYLQCFMEKCDDE